MPRLALALCLGLLATPALGEAPRASVTVAPGTVWSLPGNGVQKVNFDLLVRNEGEKALEIDEVEMQAFDGRGVFVTGRELNSLGMYPSVLTLNVREVPPGKAVVVFNPFPEFPAASEIARMRYAITLSVKLAEEEQETAKAEELRLETTVEPRPVPLRDALSLPLKGKLFVWDGHDLYSHHRRFDTEHPMAKQMDMPMNISRYGMDFMVADAEGRRHRGKGESLEDHYVYGAPVLATAPGVVADLVDGRKDTQMGSRWEVDYEAMLRTKDLRHAGGNWLVLDHGDGRYSYFAHLKPGSLKVKKGDKVVAGQVLAQVGSSGDSLEPHLHFHVLSKPDPKSEVLPAVFRSFRRHYGSRQVDVSAEAVDSGDVVEAR